MVNVRCSSCDGNQTEFHSKKFKNSFISLSICPSPIRRGCVTPPPRLITTAERVLTIKTCFNGSPETKARRIRYVYAGARLSTFFVSGTRTTCWIFLPSSVTRTHPKTHFDRKLKWEGFKGLRPFAPPKKIAFKNNITPE